MGSWRNNLAYAINRESWDKIRKCSKVIVSYVVYYIEFVALLRNSAYLMTTTGIGHYSH